MWINQNPHLFLAEVTNNTATLENGSADPQNVNYKVNMKFHSQVYTDN
jgi:hypothetical protein